MTKTLCTTVGLLVYAAVASAESPRPSYRVEMVVHEGPKATDGSSILGRPTMVMMENQPASVAIGQMVSLWREKHTFTGLRCDATVQGHKGALNISITIQRSEAVKDENGNSQIITAQLETEREFQTGEPFIIKPATTDNKSLWAEIRIEAVPE
jgi:hypothetical protein